MNSNTDPISPPRFAERLLKWFIREELAEEVLGDLDEQFYTTVEDESYDLARRNYYYEVFHYIRPFALRKTKSKHLINIGMYKNYFKIGYRNLIRSKGYSSINIGGLAIGMAVAMLLGIWVIDEISFNDVHSNHNNLVQVMQSRSNNGVIEVVENIPIPLEEELISKYGGNFKYLALSFWVQDQMLSYQDIKLMTQGNYIGKDIIKMLSLNMVYGNEEALSDPHTIILSESMSKVIFKDQNPIGQLMKINNEMSVKVTGVYEDIPMNSSFHELKFIAPWKLWETSQGWVKGIKETRDWDANYFQLYAQVEDHVTMETVSSKIKKAKYNNVNAALQESNPEILLHSMNDWHLKSSWENGVKTGGRVKYVWLLGIVGVFVLLLACINFMNLSTAQSERRAKEVGLRKAIGSYRNQLISQFLTESFLVVLIAFVIALIMVVLLLPYFNYIAQKNLIIPFGQFSFWLTSTAFILLTALLAGSYPALYLSSFSAVSVLKGTFRAAKGALVFRKFLVVVQFTVSIILIIGTLTVKNQIDFAKNRPMGYDVDGTIMVWSNTPDFQGKFETLRTALKSEQAIEEMAESSSPLTNVFRSTLDIFWEGKDPNHQLDFATIHVTPGFGKTVNWNVLAGRDFSIGMSSDSTAVILNQAAVEKMGLKDPLGKIVRWGTGTDAGRFRVIGVIENILMESPFEEPKSTLYVMRNWDMDCMTIRLNPNLSTQESLSRVEKVFNEVMPAVALDYTFTDATHSSKFEEEERIGKLSGIFALLAIAISCLGIFGMASFVAEQRTKEIGIRKVMGASVFTIWKMLSKGFIVLVIISCLIAAPIAYHFIDDWLSGFEYRTDVQWWIFLFTGVLTIVITMLTVSYHALTAAYNNPIQSLKSE
ncbi:MAG: permease prefix domain 2-containing transporter [Reichenbachiella sp.]